MSDLNVSPWSGEPEGERKPRIYWSAESAMDTHGANIICPSCPSLHVLQQTGRADGLVIHKVPTLDFDDIRYNLINVGGE